jgi:hypothetical protein
MKRRKNELTKEKESEIRPSEIRPNTKISFQLKPYKKGDDLLRVCILSGILINFHTILFPQKNIDDRLLHLNPTTLILKWLSSYHTPFVCSGFL